MLPEYICTALLSTYRISSLIRRCFSPSKTIQKSRSLGLFRKGKTRLTAKLHRTDLIICTHSREGNTLSYSRINTVHICATLGLIPTNVCKISEWSMYKLSEGKRVHVYIQIESRSLQHAKILCFITTE